MSTIDLERLIVRQTYFIPIQSRELPTAILKELGAPFPVIGGVYSWNIPESHELSFHFLFSVKYAFLFDLTWGMNLNTTKCKQLVKEKLKEFVELGTEGFRRELKAIRADKPEHVYVSVVREEKNGCVCRVECLPMLYEQLRYFDDIEPSNFEIQDSYLSCKRFLETIFQGGLSATLVSEKKKELLKPVAQLLINDQASRMILDKIEGMLEQATGEVLLCGWIGTLLLPKLTEMKEKGVKIRVITHKEKELKGKPGHQDVQRAFQELISMISKDNISIRPECHCRVVVVDNKALIGSMDLNAISLTGSHRELAIYTEDPEIVRNLRKYFNEIFSPLSKEKAK